jgi:hypothetical protein
MQQASEDAQITPRSERALLGAAFPRRPYPGDYRLRVALAPTNPAASGQPAASFLITERGGPSLRIRSVWLLRV